MADDVIEGIAALLIWHFYTGSTILTFL
jgi:hypothetical protein